MPTQDQTFGRLLNAIAAPPRRRILQVLKTRGPCSIGKDTGLCACDIEERIHLSQPTISHHMRILQKAGLVEAKKDGHWRWYQRNERTIKQFAKTLRQALKKGSGEHPRPPMGFHKVHQKQKPTAKAI